MKSFVSSVVVFGQRARARASTRFTPILSGQLRAELFTTWGAVTGAGEALSENRISRFCSFGLDGIRKNWWMDVVSWRTVTYATKRNKFSAQCCLTKDFSPWLSSCILNFCNSLSKLIINQEHHEYRAITHCIFAFDLATFYGLMSEKNWLIDLRIQFQTVSPDGLSRKGGFLPLDSCQLFHARTRQREVRRGGGRGGDFPRLF